MIIMRKYTKIVGLLLIIPLLFVVVPAQIAIATIEFEPQQISSKQFIDDNQTGCRNTSNLCLGTVKGAAPPARISEIFPDPVIARAMGYILREHFYYFTYEYEDDWIFPTSTSDIVCAAQLASLTFFYPFIEELATEVKSLEGFQYLTGLEVLSLPNQQIQDISVLERLSNLYYLDLSGNPITDFSAISTLPNLGVLNLSNTSLSDIEFMSNMPSLLEALNVANTTINDITPLYRHLANGLIRLDLSDTQVQDISVLKGFNDFAYLNLVNTPVRNVSELEFESFFRLRHVGLSHVTAVDLERLLTARGSELYALHLSNFDINDFLPLIGIVSDIQALQLSYVDLQDLSFLDEFNKLFFLNLSNNKLTNQVLSTLPDIPEKMLNLSQNNISDASHINTILRETDFRYPMVFHMGNQIANNTGWHWGWDGVPSIFTTSEYERMLSRLSINISGNAISDFSFLNKKSKLWQRPIPFYLVDMSHNEISNLSPFLNFGASIADWQAMVPFHAEIINLSHNQISDLAPIISSLSLVDDDTNEFLGARISIPRINLSHNQIDSIAPLADFRSPNGIFYIASLDLSHNQIRSLAPLEVLAQNIDLFRAVNIDFSYNQISDISPVQTLVDGVQWFFLMNLYVTNQLIIKEPITKLPDGDDIFSATINEMFSVYDLQGELLIPHSISHNGQMYADSEDIAVIWDNLSEQTDEVFLAFAQCGICIRNTLPGRCPAMAHAYFSGKIIYPLVKPELQPDSHKDKIISSGGGSENEGGANGTGFGGDGFVDGVLQRQAYLIGTPDGLLRPNDNITRAEVATILFRLITDEERKRYWSQENQFSDVILQDWFNNAVSTTTKASIFHGFPEGIFAPNKMITRAEVAAVLVRFMNAENVRTAEVTFSDISEHWAKAYINAAAARGWVLGYQDGTFRPDQPITRAEVAAMINRMFGRLQQTSRDLLPDMLTWPDNMDKGAWFYLYMQSASNSYIFEWHSNEMYEKWLSITQPRNWALLERTYSTPESIF